MVIDDTTVQMSVREVGDAQVVCDVTSAGVLVAGKVYRRCDGEPVSFSQSGTRILASAVAGPPALAEEFIVRCRALTRRRATRAQAPAVP